MRSAVVRMLYAGFYPLRMVLLKGHTLSLIHTRCLRQLIGKFRPRALNDIQEAVATREVLRPPQLVAASTLQPMVAVSAQHFQSHDTLVPISYSLVKSYYNL